MHRDQSLIEYVRFVRERAEVYGPSVMCYGDQEGINRYLGVGSLRNVTNNQAGVASRRQGKPQGICWRFNGLGRCRQNCRFKHVCDACGDTHSRIDCQANNGAGSGASHGSGQSANSGSSGGVTRC